MPSPTRVGVFFFFFWKKQFLFQASAFGREASEREKKAREHTRRGPPPPPTSSRRARPRSHLTRNDDVVDGGGRTRVPIDISPAPCGASVVNDEKFWIKRNRLCFYRRRRIHFSHKIRFRPFHIDVPERPLRRPVRRGFETFIFFIFFFWIFSVACTHVRLTKKKKNM